MADGQYPGFIRLMLNRARQKLQPPPRGAFAVPVVGESHHQTDIEGICGGRTEAGVEHPCEALLIPEHDNRYDSHAVRVEIDGLKVGYLARPDAKDFRHKYGSSPMSCAAVVRGGWDRGGDDQGHFGVYLDLRL